MSAINKPLEKSLLDTWKDYNKKTRYLEEKIFDRITYIIETWFEAFDRSISTWYFEGAEENEVGDLAANMDDVFISNIITYNKNKPKLNHSSAMVIIDKNGEEYEWKCEILTRWLFEDFEDEIINGKKLFEEKEAKRKEAAAKTKETKKLNTQKLAKQAKAKLTKEELAALKKTLSITTSTRLVACK